MLKSINSIHIVLAATMIFGVGCATDNDPPIDEAEIDDSNFELASKTQIDAAGLNVLGPETQILFGCSNAQIRSAQTACRNRFCGARGSNGIHFCDQRPPIVVAQCDCSSGEDPVIQCSLTSCPQ
jgi:hypothetical protein